MYEDALLLLPEVPDGDDVPEAEAPLFEAELLFESDFDLPVAVGLLLLAVVVGGVVC